MWPTVKASALQARIACGPPWSNSLSALLTASSRASSGTTEWTRPISLASWTEAFAGHEEDTGVGLANLAQDIGRDDGRRDAQLDLAKGEASALGCNDDITDGDESQAATHSGAVDSSKDRTGKVVDAIESIGQT